MTAVRIVQRDHDLASPGTGLAALVLAPVPARQGFLTRLLTVRPQRISACPTRTQHAVVVQTFSLVIESHFVFVLYTLKQVISVCLSPSRGGDVAVDVFDIHQPSLPTLSSCCSCVCFCLYNPFNCISFHKFSRQLSAFSVCASGLISALLVLSTVSSCESLLQP